MANNYIEDKIFEGEDFTNKPLEKGEYDHCTFTSCNFSSTSLTEIHFVECLFQHCDLSLAGLTRSVFRDTKFNDCKLLGLRFDDCDSFLFSVEYNRCVLNFSSFFKLNLKKTRFSNCELQQVDFTEADLSNAVFKECNMPGAVFDHTTLEKADLSTSREYNIDPEKNRIKKARFSLQGLPGLLVKYDIDIV